jgi:hypothetical protein
MDTTALPQAIDGKTASTKDFTQVIVYLQRNAERAEDAAELLRQTATYLDGIPTYPRPHIVRDIVIDLNLGCATIYLEKNQ